MKGKLYVRLTCLVVCIFLCAGTGHSVETEARTIFDSSTQSSIALNSEGKTVNRFTAYDISQDIYYQFIETPSKAILDQPGNETEISIYSTSTTSAGFIRREIISENLSKVEEDKEGFFRIGYYFPVYQSLIDFAGDRAEIMNYLTQNGVAGNIEDIAVLCAYGIPLTIWVKVDQKNFFITAGERLEDKVHKDTYAYRFYTHLAYCERFRQKDGTLIVNEKNITNGNCVKFHYQYVDIPLTPVMENLGASVNWIDDTKILITCNNEKYILDTADYLLTKADGTDEISLIYFGGYQSFGVIEGEVIMDNYTMGDVVELVGAKINVDYDRLIVDIR